MATTRKVTLESGPMVNTPGLLRWAMNGYHFPRDRKVLRRVFVDGFGLPDNIVHRLLLGTLAHTVEGDTVCFDYSTK